MTVFIRSAASGCRHPLEGLPRPPGYLVDCPLTSTRAATALHTLPRASESEMTRPETPWEVNGPPTGRFTPADASSAAPPLKEVKQEAIAAAPLGLMWKSALAPSSSALTLEKKRLPSAAAAPFMLEVRKEKNSTAPAPAGTSSRMAAPTVDKRIHCTVGNENINGKVYDLLLLHHCSLVSPPHHNPSST